MVAFRSLALLSLAALPSVLATVDFTDVPVKPNEIKPLDYSKGYKFENTDLIGGVLDAAGNIVEDLLVSLGLGSKKYGRGVGIIGGVDNHYGKPTRIYHSSGKPFHVLSLKALCCAANLSKHCNLLDCHIKLLGYDKPIGGNKIYDHDFYIPKPYPGKKTTPVDIDVELDGEINLGVVGIDLSGIEIDIELLDLAEVEVNGKPKRRGRYSYKPSKANGILIDIDLDVKIDL
ncbi:hypothetical protein ABW19_dt0204411 [Dactylella cylindrospora]|nr:hypothetical protein ABW19_dt0204411 [Dactylella cylindrospora]